MALREPSSNAPMSALVAVPPAAITLVAENCDAPVNTNSDIAIALGTLPPALTHNTPKEMAKTNTAKPSASAGPTIPSYDVLSLLSYDTR